MRNVYLIKNHITVNRVNKYCKNRLGILVFLVRYK